MDPARPKKKPTGGQGGRSPPPSGFGFRDPARRPGPGPPALPGITRPGSKKGYGLGQVLQAESKKRFVHSHPPSLNIRNIIDVQYQHYN